jgi:hypothetical protein
MRKLTTGIGLALILVLGLVATVGQPKPARAADGDNPSLSGTARPWRQSGITGADGGRPALAIVHTAIYDAWAAYDRWPSAPAWAPSCASRRPNGPRPTRTRRSAFPPV